MALDFVTIRIGKATYKNHYKIYKNPNATSATSE